VYATPAYCTQHCTNIRYKQNAVSTEILNVVN
jgi:hypothetical protein